MEGGCGNKKDGQEITKILSVSAENQERHMENITTVIECPNENGKTEEKKKENKYLVIVLLYIRML